MLPIPCKPAHIGNWTIPESINLADPLFYRPGNIDVLLGSEIFFQLLQPGQLSLGANGTAPILQNTKLGWVVAGRYDDVNPIPNSPVSTCLLISIDDELSKQLRRFWELEEYAPLSKHLSEEELLCEQHFCQYTNRDESGKFVVRLPFSQHPRNLGNSLQIA